MSGKKGNIAVLIDPLSQKQQWISPNNLTVFIGPVKTDDKNNKYVNVGTPILLGVFLSEKENELRETKKELRETKKELSDLKINYKKNMKILIGVINVLVAQTEINSLDLNELLDMEDN